MIRPRRHRKSKFTPKPKTQPANLAGLPATLSTDKGMIRQAQEKHRKQQSLAQGRPANRDAATGHLINRQGDDPAGKSHASACANTQQDRQELAESLLRRPSPSPAASRSQTHLARSPHSRHLPRGVGRSMVPGGITHWHGSANHRLQTRRNSVGRLWAAAS